MAGDRSPGGHGKLSETYSIDLMSKKIYDGMENDSQDLSEYNGKCNDIVVPSNKEEVKTLCKKVLRYLEKSPVWSVQESVYDTCLLLNFWIYDKLTQIFFNKEKKDIAFGNFQTLLKNHSENQKNISADKKCTDKFHILNKVDWKHRKEFKCKYKPKECPHFYEQCKNYNPDVVLRNFPCHVQIEAAKNALNTEETSDQGLPDGPRPHGFDLSRHEASSSEAGMTQENSDIGTKVGRSVLGVAPIALTASALYKFTPLGPWIRKISGSSHNITSNGFGDEEQESVNMFFDGGENYISYQPI
ncbi:PIR Superfamily Protein [Plasmodium ovale curtisi]|uniref:PIR Superfamily Protein n=1 Tax=Plasmodium ovale curtisi TaxID=864141 RepID=A0A1A8W810_PLAOA|nr:PIR Superfamily Protein [Plasmodium ovale curtisi]